MGGKERERCVREVHRNEKERGKKKYREIMGVEDVGGVREISREGKREEI